MFAFIRSLTIILGLKYCDAYENGLRIEQVVVMWVERKIGIMYLLCFSAE